MGERACLAERFLRGADRSAGDAACWPWTGTVLSTGYGQMWHGGKPDGTHRLSWYLRHGPIPKGMHVLHRCNYRTCVNPGHLYVGTHRDNMRDRKADGRYNAPNDVTNRDKTHCPQGHPYDDRNTYRYPTGGRVCRACRFGYRSNHGPT